MRNSAWYYPCWKSACWWNQFNRPWKGFCMWLGGVKFSVVVGICFVVFLLNRVNMGAFQCCDDFFSLFQMFCKFKLWIWCRMLMSCNFQSSAMIPSSPRSFSFFKDFIIYVISWFKSGLGVGSSKWYWEGHSWGVCGRT